MYSNNIQTIMPFEEINMLNIGLEPQEPDNFDINMDVDLPREYTMTLRTVLPMGGGAINSISVNGVEVPIVEGNVDVTVPTSTSQLLNDSGYITSSAISGKVDRTELAQVAFSGDYDDLENKPDIEDIAANVASSAVSTHNESEEAHSDIRNEIGTVKSIAEGANIAIVFDSYSALVAFFNSESDSLKVGANLYVKTIDVPDLWISSVESESVSYTYTTDADFLTYINGNGQIGYYKFSELETQKVDLSNYATSTDLGTKVSKSGDTMTGDLTMDGSSYIIKVSGTQLWRIRNNQSHLELMYSANGGTSWSVKQRLYATQDRALFSVNNVYVGNQPTDENYKLQRYSDIYTTGIISDTKTWTEQADGSYSYVVSDPVTGAIPNSFITEWNTKCGLYGRQTLPRAFNATTGYFELNGLYDITYEEAIVILTESTMLTMQGNNYPNSRTNLGIRLNSASIARQWQASNSEVAYWANTSWLLGSTTSSTTFLYSCPRLRAIIYSRWSSIQGNLTITNCPSLTTIEIVGAAYGAAGNLNLTGAPNLSLQSIVGMVNSAQNNTAAKTYTVAGNTWTACQNDTTQYTYRGQTYTGIIDYAAAKNITITN